MRSLLAAGMFMALATAICVAPVHSQPAAPATVAATRIALVVGIGDYNDDGDVRDTDRAQADAAGYVTDLPNALNDAQDVQASLRGLGYDVTYVRNPERDVLLQSILGFGAKIRAAGPDAKVVIFYAGHGIQVDGVNFLIPAKARMPSTDFSAMPSIDAQTLMSQYATPLNELLQRLQARSDNGINLLILDACRDNPWDQRMTGVVSRGGGGASRGLADVPVGMRRTIIAFSTKPGDTAADGDGRNSPYTTALVRWMGQGNTLPITSMLGRVAGEVEQMTARQRQRQITHVSYLGNVEDACLVSCAPSEADTIARLQNALAAALSPATLRTVSLTEQSAGRGRRQQETARQAAGALDGGFAAATYDTADDGLEVALQYFRNGGTVAALERAVVANDGEALYLMGLTKWYGLSGQPIDLPAARELLRRSLFRGFARASLAYGSMLFSGDGGPKNEAEAVNWWRSGADAGYAPAIDRLGNYYAFSAPAAERSFTKALPYFERAAAAGDPGAQVQVVDYDWYGRDRPKNPGVALAAYEQLASRGNAVAMTRLADAYRFGTNVPKDPARARQYFERAAQIGSTDAARALGLWLEAGGEGVTADAQAAAPYLLQAQRASNAQASSQLAKLLINKTIAEIPGVDPVALAVSADERGYPEGLGALTAVLREGKNGWEKDLKRAAEYARPAYRRALARPLSEDGAWPLHTRGYAYAIQLALTAEAIAPETPTELADLNRLWGELGKGMKRFTVPVDFSGVSHPFHVYIWDAPNAPVPTDAQFDWVEQARGGRVPEDVRESFRKLFKIAKDNNVSFQDLCVYALNAAQQTPPPPEAAVTAASPELLAAANEDLRRAEGLLRQNDPVRAIESATSSIQKVPQSTAYGFRGNVYETRGDTDLAIADFDTAARLAPTNASFQNSRCWVRAVANRDLTVAHTACDEALRLKPGEGDFLDSHGLVLLRLGNFQESWSEYNKAVQVNASRATYLYGRGIAALRLGRTADGQRDLAAASALDANIAKTYADFGVTP